MSGIVAIENALVARVQAASDGDVLGYRLKTVDHYGGQLDADELKQIVAQFPAVYFVFGGEPRPEAMGASQYLHRPVWGAICCANIRGNEGRSRHGAGSNPGSYQIATDIRQLIVGQDFGLQIENFEPGRMQVLFNGTARREALSLVSVEFHTAYVDGLPDATGLDDFSTFHAAWDVPVLGNVADPAGSGDATDQLENLET